MTHDREILDILDQLKAQEFSGTLWRTSWKTRDPLQGGIGGGRWSPSNKFTALYTSLDKNVSITELHYHLSQAPVFSSCAMIICKLKATQLSLLDLSTKDRLKTLKLDLRNKKQISRSQDIGAAVQFLGHQGFIVPSFRTSGKNCVLFSDEIGQQKITLEFSQNINWPAWIKRKI